MKLHLFFLIAFFLITPLLILSSFINFSADDFCHSFKVTDLGWLNSQLDFYKNWSGRYFSTFLVFSALFFKTPFLAKIISFFSIILFFFIMTMFFKKHLFENSIKNGLIFSLCLFVLYISGMPSLSQGFYWLTGILTYTVPLILLLVLFSIIKGFANDDERGVFKVAAAIALSFGLTGSNEVAMLLVLLLLLLFLMYFKILGGSFNYLIFLLILTSIIFAFIVIMAPGNQIRSGQFVNNHKILSSFLYSILMLGALLTVWMLNPLLWLLSLFYIKVRKEGVVRVRNYSTKDLVFVFVGLSGSMFSTVFPSFWATNTPPPGRSLNISYLMFLFLIMTSIEIGLRTINFKFRLGFLYRSGVTMSVFFLFFHLFFSFKYSEFPAKQGDVHNYSKNLGTSAEYFFKYYGRNNYADVFGDVISWKISDYAKTMEKREKEMYLCDKNSVCIVSRIEEYPRSILFRDIENDENDWKNICYSEYFNLKAVKTSE